MVSPKYPLQYDDVKDSTPEYLPVPGATTAIYDFVNRTRNSIIAVEHELGIKPSGAQATVSQRLDLIEAGNDGYGTQQSIHRVQIADKYSINEVYNRYLVVGQIGLNALYETGLSLSIIVSISIMYKIHVYVQENTILTTRLYDITNGGLGKLLKENVFNDTGGNIGGHFTEESMLTIQSDIPLSERVYELRAIQTEVGPVDPDKKSIIWDASLIVKSTIRDGYDGYTVEGTGGISNILYVDSEGGDDITALRGSIVFKFKTIAAALSKAISKDLVFIGPGTYNEDLTLPDISELTILGSGRNATTINSTMFSITKISSAPITKLEIMELSMVAPVTIFIDGQSIVPNPGAFLNGYFFLKNVMITSSFVSMWIACAGGVVIMENVLSFSGVHLFGQTQMVLLGSCFFNDTTFCDWDPALNLPTGGIKMEFNCKACNFQDVELYNIVKAYFDASSSMVRLKVDQTGIPPTNNYAFVRSEAKHFEIEVDGYVGDYDYTVANFDRAIMESLDVDNIGVDGYRALVSARNSVITGSATAPLSFVVNARNLVDIDIIGATYDGNGLSQDGDGSIQRSYEMGTILAGIGANTITYDVPFTTTDYTITFTAWMAGADIYLTAKDVDQAVFDCAANGNVDYVIQSRRI